jgi:DNA polymerase-3 subunit alpha
MDFLGLSNLTIIKNALRIIKRVYGDDIDIGSLPLDDSLTYELFQKGDTTGVFQFESAGMKRYLKQLKPTVFDDLIAMNALYRPGPMQFIDDFIDRKHGKKKVVYEHEGLKAALENTYGVLVYQEQFMQISKDMCGFTGGQADTLRQAIGKKKRETMAKMKTAFIDGMIEHSQVERNFAEKFWVRMEAFADYGFNKVHSACYATIAYQTAYLKAHYPTAFMAALMSSDYDDTDRLAIEITECQHMDIKVLPPDVNESFVEFAVVPGQQQIRFGLTAVKNVGTGAVEEILRARQEGQFTGLEDFLARVNPRIVNRKGFESLVKAGAFDRFGERGTLLHNIDMLLAYASRLHKQASSGQTDLFGNQIEDIVPANKLQLQLPPEQISAHEQLVWERELLGLYLSQHPLAAFTSALKTQTVPLNSLNADHHNQLVSVGGAITDVRQITTKNGQRMAFVRLEDNHGNIEAVVFPGSFQDTARLLERDKVVKIRGKLTARGRDGQPAGEIKVIVDEVTELKPDPAASQPDEQRVYVRLDSSNDQDILLSLKKAIDAYQGKTEVVLVFNESSRKQAIKLPGGIDPDSEAVSKLQELVGAANLVIK